MTERVHVSIPAELLEAFRAKRPDASMSQVVQDALRGALACEHRKLACRHCRESLARRQVVDAELDGFYRDLMWKLDELVNRCGTAEGAVKVIRDVARAWLIPESRNGSLLRPSRANRERYGRTTYNGRSRRDRS